MGQVLAIGMNSQNTTHSIYLENKFDNDLKKLIKLADDKNCTWREKRHVQAVNYFARGYFFFNVLKKLFLEKCKALALNGRKF